MKLSQLSLADYNKLDRRLGTNEDFKEVCKELHKNGIKVVVDGEDADDFLIFIADIDGRRFEDAAVFSLGQVTRMVLEFVGLAAQGIEDGHGRAIADFAVGDVAVFNGYNGIFFVIIAQVMDDDFTVRAELVSQAFGQMA